MNSLFLFLIAAAVLIATPGPDIVYVLTRGVSGGKRAGIISAIGVTLGILFHTVSASLGLAVLLQTSTYAFWALKIVGGLYLIYLGLQMVKHRKHLVLKQAQHGRFNITQCITQGFLSNVFNPKVALFFVAFLPQFVQPGTPNPSLYMMMLGLMYALMTVAFLSILGIFAGIISGWLQQRSSVSEWISGAAGTVIILLGIKLLLQQRT